MRRSNLSTCSIAVLSLGLGLSFVASPAGAAEPGLQLAQATRPAEGMTASPNNPVKPLYSLESLLKIARQQSPLLAVSRSEELAARAGITTARAYPNPELDFAVGRANGRGDGGSGFAPSIGIAQPLENPWLRSSRIQTAQARAEVASSQTGLTQVLLVAEIKRRFLEVARLKEEVQAFQEDLRLAEQIRVRVQVRVRTGEAPRFDLIRADTEVAVAAKNLSSSSIRMQQALGQLRQSISPTLESEFDIKLDDADVALLEESDYRALRDRLERENPDIIVARREYERALRQIEVEQALALPQVSLRATQDRDPSVTINRIGAQIQIPIFNRREGPIAEAQAQAERARLQLEQRQFEFTAGFDSAWQGYKAAAGQVRALESGIVDRSRSVIEVAEAAYRFGERGILEFLDAQRQFRLVRNELIQARFTARLARTELERIAGLR